MKYLCGKEEIMSRSRMSLLVCGLLLVLTSWVGATILQVPGQYPTIQAGINASSNGDTVMLAPGTYTGVGNRNVFIGSRTVTLKSSGGPDVTMVDCQSLNRFAWISNANVRIEGLTITNGSLGYAGAIYCDNGSTGIVSCCNFVNNIAGSGGAIYGYGSDVHFVNCTFDGNRGTSGSSFGGAMHIQYSPHMVIDNCTFVNNQAAYGSAISTDGSTTALTNCVFRNNNTVYTGACYFANGPAVLTNCVLWGNTADYWGPAVSTSTSDVVATNCTIIWNHSINYNEGGAFYFCMGGLTINNCILWGNSSPQIFNYLSTSTVSYTDVQDGFSGTGNINQYPSFVDSAAWDCHLALGSPCIDAGNPSSSYNDPAYPGYPIYAIYPSRGLVRNDMGAYGGPGADDWSTCSYGPPAAPIHLVIVVSNARSIVSGVTLTWESVSGVSSYRVYSSTEPDDGFAEDTTGVFDDTSWTAPVPDMNTFYYVTAVGE